METLRPYSYADEIIHGPCRRAELDEITDRETDNTEEALNVSRCGGILAVAVYNSPSPVSVGSLIKTGQEIAYDR